MVDLNSIISNIDKTLSKLSTEEKIEYLKRMGFKTKNISSSDKHKTKKADTRLRRNVNCDTRQRDKKYIFCK
jgi:hypothetical protein